MAAARRIVKQVDEAEREAAGEFTAPRGELVITAPILFGRLHVLPVVTGFLALFPEINVHLLLSDRNVDLVDDHIDMAVRIGALPDSSMVATRVGSMRTVVCASPTLLEGHGVPRRPEDVQKLPCVMFDSPDASAELALSGRRFEEILLAPRLLVTTAEAAAQAAIDIGLTRLFHYQVVEAVENGALKIVLEPFEPELAPIHLVHAARTQMSLKMRRFLDFAAPRLRQGMNQLGFPG